MAQARKKKKTTKKPTKRQQQRHHENKLIFQGIIMTLISVVALFKWGFIGRFLTRIIQFFVGNSSSFALTAIIIIGIYQIITREYFKFQKHNRMFGILWIYIAILLSYTVYYTKIEKVSNHVINHTFTSWLNGYYEVGGGMIGATLYQGIAFLLSKYGVYLMIVISVIAGVMITFNISLTTISYYLHKFVNWLKEWFMSLETLSREENKAKPQKQTNTIKDTIKAFMEDEEDNNSINESIPEPIQHDEEILVYEPEMPKQEPIVKEEPVPSEPLEPMVFTNNENDNYQLPPISLLTDVATVDQSDERRSVEYKKKILKKTFDSFGVDATVEDYHVGPAITKFEIKLAVGVKVSKIINLADDIALALAAKDVRIEAPIPGKSLIGIEVPNQSVRMVSFKEVMQAKPQNNHNLLEVPLGKDISGEVIMANLAKMPHLLIAGSTGSGKSVCINGIITSLLMQAKPNEVKLMMIDPKMVELNVYNGIPHLLTPVVTNPRKASQALHKLVEEMERRYELFAQTGVRNMSGYNEYVSKHPEENLTSMPYIVVIVDELADLMMVASKEVEDAITRLAQMARAAGIHMILATQRPSVDVITGLIKANVPSRIAFAVSSGTDSRTILDGNGAEKLLGRGDMLFIPIGENKPMRVQGAFISDEEVEKIVNFITDQKGPEYQENMTPTEEVEQKEDKNDNTPARFDEAVEIVQRAQKASASLIQRRLHVGYNAAANIIEEMENRGMVGPANGSKPREVYLPPLTEEGEN